MSDPTTNAGARIAQAYIESIPGFMAVVTIPFDVRDAKKLRRRARVRSSSSRWLSTRARHSDARTHPSNAVVAADAPTSRGRVDASHFGTIVERNSTDTVVLACANVANALLSSIGVQRTPAEW